MSRQYDTIVIGSGPAGLAAAFRLAKHGQRVAIIEKYLWGGTCPNYGCDPKKILLTAVETIDRQNNLSKFGVEGKLKINWTDLQSHRKSYTDAVHDRKIAGLDHADIAHYFGTGKFVDNHTVLLEPDNLELQADNIVIAVGQRQKILDFEGFDLVQSSEDFLKMPELPEKIMLIGAGFVGMEFATITATAGVETYVVTHGDKALREFDQELVEDVIDNLEQKNTHFIFNTEIKSIVRQGNHLLVTLKDDTSIEVDAVYNAAGRIGNADRINIENTDAQIDQFGNVVVNEYLQTTSNIYAIGDVAEAGVDKLVPTGNFQGRYVADHIVGKISTPIKYPAIATVAFTSPKIAKVGVDTQEDSKTRTFHMEKVITFYRAEDKAVIKSVVDDNRVMLGASVLSELAEELINSFVMAINLKQDKEDVLNSLSSYPSLASDMADYF